MTGWKTYLAAAGLAGLALYQLSTGNVEAATQSFLAALAAVGLRSAIGTPKQEPTVPASLNGKSVLPVLLCCLLLASSAFAQGRPAVGEEVRNSAGQLVYSNMPACPPQYRSTAEHKAFFFFINRGGRDRAPQTDPAVLQALQALQQNQSRMIELIAALKVQPAPPPATAPLDPALIALLQRQSQPQAPPTIIILDRGGSAPRQDLVPEPRPRQDLIPEPRPRQDLPVEPRPRQDLPVEPRPRQDLIPEPRPRQDLQPDGPKPRQDLGKPDSFGSPPATGKGLVPPRGEPKGPPTTYQQFSRKAYTTAIWR